MEGTGEAQGHRREVATARETGPAALVCQPPGADVRRHRRPGRVPDGFAGDRYGAGSDIEREYQVTIPRRFAIATKEVTVEQFQRVRSRPTVVSNWTGRRGHRSGHYSPDSDGPWIGPNWYAAAAYCNWLSKQEGLPEDQWCYLPNKDRAYAEGMTIPANVLERTGYRLAHRGGMGICLPSGHGHQPILWCLGRACWGTMPGISPTAGIVRGRAGACCPMIWGSSTCLGNVYEWCQDRNVAFRPSENGSIQGSRHDR